MYRLCRPWRGGGQFSGVASRRRGQLEQLSVASSHELSLVLTKCPFIPSKMGLEINFRVLVTVLFLLCCVQQGLSIKCWVCRSDSDPKCADPFDNSTVPISDCKQEPDLEHLPGVRPTMCRKIRQKVNGVWRYFRSCAYMGEPGIQGDERFCLMRTGTYNIFMEYCTCNSKDGCNAAPYNRGGLIVSLIAAIASLRHVLVYI